MRENAFRLKIRNPRLNPRNLPTSPTTGNFQDSVSDDFADYVKSVDVPVSFEVWHDAYAPEHRSCNFCLR